MVKCQIEGSNVDEILWIIYSRKSDKTRNPMKPKLIDLDLRSGRYRCFKISKNPHSNLGKRWKFWFLKWNYLSKSNLNYINFKDYDRITLLTWLTRRLGFKSRELKCIFLVSSSTCIRHSRGDSNRFLQSFMINPASIWSKLSLERRGSWRT